MWIMVSGPYTSGGADAAGRHANLDAMNAAAVALALADRCDAVLRIGGASSGADLDVPPPGP